METRELPLFMHFLKPGQKNRKHSFFSPCLFYQYADEPEVNIVVFAQPGAVDLQALTREKYNHAICDGHQARDDQRREQQPANETVKCWSVTETVAFFRR